MNIKLTLRLVGKVLMVVGVLMLLPLVVSLFMKSGDAKAILIAMGLTIAMGGACQLFKPANDNLRAREGFAVVALSWILVSFFGGLPFYFHGCIPSLVDCFFETVSGFTTTGATILSNVEVVPKGLMLWRSFTHWAGGMGVLVLSLAIFPKMGARSIHLMRAESPGPSTEKLVPRIGNSAKILYSIYIGMSVLMFVVLLLCGMNVYDAAIDMFGSAGTGGFCNYAAGCSVYTPLQQVVTGIFMALFGINFAMYYYILKKNYAAVWSNSEWKLYLIIMLGASVIIAFNIMPMYNNSFLTSLREGFFQSSSIMTTTGYASTDFDKWPTLSKMILVGLMFVGGCAGSTGGGIKVIRFQLMSKCVVRDIRRTIHPKSVNVIKLDGRTVNESILNGVQGFFCAYFFIMIIATLLISIDGFSFESNVTAVIATMSNIGPGLGMVGPTGSFAAYSDFSKIILSLCMLIGRLDIFPILMLAMPSAWKD